MRGAGEREERKGAREGGEGRQGREHMFTKGARRAEGGFREFLGAVGAGKKGRKQAVRSGEEKRCGKRLDFSAGKM